MPPLHCFIHSPLAYLCMRELIASTRPNAAHGYIIATSVQSSALLRKMAAADDWDSLEVVVEGQQPGLWGWLRDTASLVRGAMRLRSLVSRIAFEDRIVLCHLSNPYSRLICEIRRRAVPHERFLVVDDGTTTLVEHQALLRDGQIPITRLRPRSKSMYSSLESLLYSQAPILSGETEFFSFWPLAQPSSSSDPMLAGRNRFSRLRSMLVNREREDMVYFVGQPFVRRGVVSPAGYCAILKRIQEHFLARGIEFVYVPHRNENTSAYGAGFKILRSDEPVELLLLNSNSWPRVVAGFYSACIATCLHLFQGRIDFEVFWGFAGLAPEDGSPIAAAFRAECGKPGGLAINTLLAG